jgi:ribosomal protein S18 acetylase RimI-like enzyme
MIGRQARPRAARVVVDRLKAADVDACARIVAGDPLWQRYGLTYPRARRAIGKALGAARHGQRAAKDEGELAGARLAGRLIGFIWFRLDGTFHHSGYVRWVGVAPDAQGRGVGGRLMRYAEERILGRGPNVFLLVSDFNRRAQAFYESRGYRRVGAIPDYIVAGVTEYLYRKTRGPIAARRGG